MNRRTVLKGGFVLAATTHTMTGIAIADPVINAIKSYRDGMKAYCEVRESDWDRYGGEEALIGLTYGPHGEALDNWNEPCTSKEGAIEALRFALKESQDYYSEPCVTSMISAALAYLEGAAA